MDARVFGAALATALLAWVAWACRTPPHPVPAPVPFAAPWDPFADGLGPECRPPGTIVVAPMPIGRWAPPPARGGRPRGWDADVEALDDALPWEGLPEPPDPWDALGPGGCLLPPPGGRAGPDDHRLDRLPDPNPPTSGASSVDRALDWLARHQSRDGSWSCDAFAINCRVSTCGGAGASAGYTPGTSGLALLAFLGMGHSMRHGRYREVVKRGLKYLMAIQTPDGCIGPKVAEGHYIYNHAIGTMALAEAYGLSGLTPSLKGPAQKAVDFLMSAQNPGLGWRYGIRPGDNDTSVTAWAVLALKSARLAELNVPAEAFAGARKWFDKVTGESFYETRYTHKGDDPHRWSTEPYQPCEAMTAAALACRSFMGAKPLDPEIVGGAKLLEGQPPKWDPEGGNDFYYWYFGSLVMFQLGGDGWRVWSQARDAALEPTQRRGGDADGSWDPASAWGDAGGRVYATAINALTLEIYYHGYPKVPARPGTRPK